MPISELGYVINPAGLKKGERALDSFERKNNKAALAVSGLVKAFGAMAVVAATTFSFRRMTNEIATFETAMSGVGAVTRATASDLQLMRDKAKELGSTTEFSSAQAADGLRFLGMAGFSAQEAVASLSATLDLATAAGMDLASSADIVSNIMSGFGIEAANAANVTDILAAAASRSNTDVYQLGDAMKFAAPVARAMGISIEDTAAAIGVLSDAGLQGSQAGTGLRAVLASLSKPSEEASKYLKAMGVSVAEVNPATNELADIMAKLAMHGLNAEAAMAIFGREAASAGLVMAGASGHMADFGDELTKVDGEAARMAETMRDNLGGDIKTLGSAVSGLILQLGEAGLTAALRGATQGITATISGVQKFIKYIGDMRGYIIAAASVMTLYYTPAIIAATVATGGFIAGLVTMRGALITTGIGAIVVTAGYLVNKFLNLIEVTGSFSGALVLLGDIAGGVWDGIVTSAGAIVPGLNSVWEMMKSGFYLALGSMQERWLAFLSGIANGISNIPFLSDIGISDSVNSAIGSAMSTLSEYDALAQKASNTSATLAIEAGNIAVNGFDIAEKSLSKMNDAIILSEIEALGNQAQGAVKKIASVADIPAAFDGIGESATGAAKKTKKALDDIEKAAKKYADTMNGYVKDGISSVVDWMVSGFKGGMSSLWDIFTNTIKQMIAYALKNRIMMSLGLTTGVAGTAASAASAAGGFGGGGGILGSIGSILGVGGGGLAGLAGSGGIMGAIGSIASGLGGVLSGGGLGSSFANLGGLLSGASSGLGAFGAAIPAIGLIAVGISAIFGKTKELDNGLRITIGSMDSLSASASSASDVFGGMAGSIDGFSGVIGSASANISSGLIETAEGMGVLVQAFSKTQTKRLLGLIKSNKTKLSPAEQETAQQIADIITGVQDSIISAAKYLNIGADVFEGFAASIDVSLKGLSKEDKIKAVEDALSGLSDQFAEMIPGLVELSKGGEGATETLERLVNSLSSVNTWWDRLGFGLYELSLSGADAASVIADLYGGLDTFAAATGAYYDAFYSDSERLAQAIKEMDAALEELGVSTMPTTNAAFRALVDAAQAAGDDELVANLILLASGFDAITSATTNAAASLKASDFATMADYQYAQARRASGDAVSTATDMEKMSTTMDSLLTQFVALTQRVVENTQTTADEAVNARLSSGVVA